MLDRVYLLLAVLVVGVAPASAQAQGWLEDRARTEGPGIRVGDLELHPGVGVEIGYDSNVFYEDEIPQGSAILRGTAHLLVSTLSLERLEEGAAQGGQESVRFRGGLSISGYHFFIDRAKDNVGGDLNLDLTINPHGTFTFRIYENFGRAIRPFTDSGGMSDDITYGRNQNVAGAEVSIRSRADILKLRAGYELGYEFFDDDVFDYVDNLSHRIGLDASFRFFPNTAIVNANLLEFQTYPNSGDEPASLVTNSTRYTSSVGINGAFTNTLSATILGGYSVGFYSNGDDYESIVARVEGRWQPQQDARLALGYERRFRPSFVGNFFREDKGYFTAQTLLGGAFLLGFETSAALYNSGVVLAPDAMTPLGTQAEREGVRVEAKLFAEYRLTNWLGVNTSLRYIADFTDYQYGDPGGAGALPDPAAAYQKFEAWLGVRAFY